MNLDELNERDFTLNELKYEFEVFKKLPKRIQLMLFLENDLWHGRGNIAYCEYKSLTPIEQIFYLAWDIIQDRKDGYIYLNPQHEIQAGSHKYIADFCFEPSIQFYEKYTNCSKRLVIECDGHDFHEKTKEQVKRDNGREYDLKMAGYDVLRFSGSEIYNTPYACAEKAINYIKKMIAE